MTFEERINPAQFGFSPKLVAVVGAIINYDYNVRDRKGGLITGLTITSDGFVTANSTASNGGGAFIGTAEDLERNLIAWKTELTPEDAAEFDRKYAANVKDWRKS